ncbi:MAG TPA: two-component system response regulator [Nitrospiraceae bacterium]|nr:two-component system response regulator [Nitrospiraceae bacterium]
MEHILFVDDEAHILDGFQRQFRKRFQVSTALGAQQALELITAQGPFAVVVSDMCMPGIDGIRFLGSVRKIIPETVRIMLTGNADVRTAIEAVNQGEIFRFLTKPCPPANLTLALEAGIHQYQLIRAEKELLEGTLRGSLQALSDLLAVVNPEAFGRASRLKGYVVAFTQHMGISDTWQMEIAAVLSQIGCVNVSQSILKKINTGEALTSNETQAFHHHPLTGSGILANIPRMEAVAKIILYQQKHFDGSGWPQDLISGKEIPLGARLLKIALDFDYLRMQNYPPNSAYEELQSRQGWYDPTLLQALKPPLVPEQIARVVSISLDELQPHMIVAEEIYDQKNNLLVAKGLDLTEWMVNRLKQMTGAQAVREPIQVILPESSSRNEPPVQSPHLVQ